MAPPKRRDDDGAARKSVGESVIRMMTRLSIQHGAVNLSQGFPNEPPPASVRVALARAVLTGRPSGDTDSTGGTLTDAEEVATLRNMMTEFKEGEGGGGEEEDAAISDELNQYSPPMGRPDVREAISAHYLRHYGHSVSPEDITVTLGATEAVASALRTIGKPGDRVVIFEPFHELYPSQCRIFWMEPTYVTLREDEGRGTWSFDATELEGAIRGYEDGEGNGDSNRNEAARALVLNTPHNPTGKVFTRDELEVISDLCLKYGTYVITDEIYEWMTYGERRHLILPKEFPAVANRSLICNSMGKSASATGWRMGWCLHPPALSSTYRGVHDQLVVMSPHPVQYAALTYLDLPDSYFRDTLSTRYLGRLRRLAGALRRAGFGVSDPEAAYYLFARYHDVPALSDLDPWDAAVKMLREVGVACVPGDNFFGSKRALGPGGEGKRYLRFAACRSWEDVEEACLRIGRALGREQRVD